MKKNLLIGLVVTAVIVVCGVGGYLFYREKTVSRSDVEPEIVLGYGEVNPEGHIMTESAHYFADRVYELTEGKVMIQIYPSGQLGDDARCYQSMKIGALDMCRGNSMSLLEQGMPMISVLALPYIFRDREHFWKVCSSSLGKEIIDNIQDSTGMVGLAYLDEGARNFFTVDRPIHRVEDMQNLKIRVQVDSMMGDAVKALGAEPVPIDYVELYTALESGTVSGAENPPVSYYYNNFYKVAPYYVRDGHTYSPSVILISKITWRNLEAEYKEALLQAAGETQDYNRSEIEQADKAAYEALERNGVKILELEDQEKWRDAMEPVYTKYGAEYMELIKQIRQME